MNTGVSEDWTSDCSFYYNGTDDGLSGDPQFYGDNVLGLAYKVPAPIPAGSVIRLTYGYYSGADLASIISDFISSGGDIPTPSPSPALPAGDASLLGSGAVAALAVGLILGCLTCACFLVELRRRCHLPADAAQAPIANLARREAGLKGHTCSAA